MGYVRNKTFKLTWADDTEFAGLEVRAKSLPLGVFLQLEDILHLKDRRDRDFTADDLAKIDRVFGMFADALMSWNLEEEDGTPVPATKDGLLAQDFEFSMAVLTQWMSAVSNVPEGLGKDSTSGGPSPEALELPMEPLSESHAS